MSPKLWGLGFLEIAGGRSDKKCWFCPLYRQEPGARCRSALELPENLGVCSQNVSWIWSLLHFQLQLLYYNVSNCNWKQSLKTYILYYGNQNYVNEQLIMSNAVLWILFAFKEDGVAEAGGSFWDPVQTGDPVQHSSRVIQRGLFTTVSSQVRIISRSFTRQPGPVFLTVNI